MRVRSLMHLSPRALLAHLTEVLAREREATAELILCLAEVLRRRLYAAEGYPSMHAYCVGALRLSEDEAGKRIRVVRMARRFPQILEMVADGRLHLSGVCLLAPHLVHENARELLAAATHRTKREIEQLLAERFPQGDVPERVQPFAPGAVVVTAQSVPGRISTHSMALSALPSGGSSAAPMNPGTPGEAAGTCVAPQQDPVPVTAGATAAKSVPGRIFEAPATPRPRVAPLAPERYAVQFTMDQAMHDDLTRAQQLLGRAVAPGEITEVFRRALRELVAKLEKQKFAAPARPRAQKARPAGRPVARNPRHVPAGLKRQVLARDGGRCTFVSDTGHRCESREALEIDHVIPVAKGGAPTLANLRLLCRTHNQYEAGQAFGEGFMHEIRERARRSAAEPAAPHWPT